MVVGRWRRMVGREEAVMAVVVVVVGERVLRRPEGGFGVRMAVAMFAGGFCFGEVLLL